MHIWIFQTGEPLHIDQGDYRPMRAMLLADALIERDHKVTIISSAFFHQRKTFRSKTFKTIKVKKNLIIELLPSIGYKKHIGIKRLLDHLILSFNLYRFLKNRNDFLPDRIFLGYPPIETAFVMIRWAKKFNIPVMLDIKDNWPDNFIDPFPKKYKKLAKIFIYPYIFLAKFIFTNSDQITTITESFVTWIKLFSKSKNKMFGNFKGKYHVFPLVRRKIYLSKQQHKDANFFWLNKKINILEGKQFVFVGSLSNSFDFNFIFELASFLLKKYPEYKFIICGTGDKLKELNKLFSHLNNVFLIGEVNKYNSSLLIRKAVATLAPYKSSKNFESSIPNKVIESLENKIPFITRTKGDLKDLIDKYNNGVYLDDKMSNLDQVIRLIEDVKFRKLLCENAFKCYEKLFNFEKAYSKIITNIISMDSKTET